MKLLLFLALSPSVFGGQVIDLGKIEISGAVRGPKIRVVESEKINVQTKSKFIGWYMKVIEKKLLTESPESMQ